MALLLRVAWGTQLHPDETLVYLFTRFDAAYAVNYLATADIQAPLWLALFWYWRHLFLGDSEFAGRMLSLLFSLITLALSYRIGRDWFGKPRYGFFAMLTLGMSAYFLNYALEIRPYALVMLLSTLSMWLLARWLTRGTWRLAVAYGVVTALMFYVHYFTMFLVIAQVLYFLLRRPSRQLVFQAIGAFALTFLLWLPWLPSFLNQASLIRQVVAEAGNGYALGIGTPSTTQPTSLKAVVDLASLASNGLPILYAGVALLGVLLLWRSAYYRLALMWAFGVPLIALVTNLFVEVFTPRYIVYMVVGLALVLSAALATLRRPVLRNLAFGIFVTINLLAVPSWLPVRPPYRDLYAQVSAAARIGDVVLNVPESAYDQFFQWEQRQYLPQALQADIATNLEQAEQARRIWFMTSDWFNPLVRDQFNALEPTHPVQRVIGQCDNSWCYLAQLMEAPPLTDAQRFGENVDFWGIDVDEVTADSIATRLWWRVEQTPSLDYSISLRLVNSTGEVVAQNDGAINHYGAQIVQTSQLEPGRIYIDWRTLSLPPELPAGVYTLQLVVYQSWDGTRLLLPDGSDTLTLDTVIRP